MIFRKENLKIRGVTNINKYLICFTFFFSVYILTKENITNDVSKSFPTKPPLTQLNKDKKRVSYYLDIIQASYLHSFCLETSPRSHKRIQLGCQCCSNIFDHSDTDYSCHISFGELERTTTKKKSRKTNLE